MISLTPPYINGNSNYEPLFGQTNLCASSNGEKKLVEPPNICKRGINNNCEENQFYTHIILNIDHRNRVIQCHDNIQWIIQRLAGQRYGVERFRSICYIRTRKRLINACLRLNSQLGQAEICALNSLPQICGGSS